MPIVDEIGPGVIGLDIGGDRGDFFGEGGAESIDGGESFVDGGVAKHIRIEWIDIAGGTEEENAATAEFGFDLAGHGTGVVGGDDQLRKIHADDRMDAVVDQRDKGGVVGGATDGHHAHCRIRGSGREPVAVIPEHLDGAVGIDDAAVVALGQLAVAIADDGGLEEGLSFLGGGDDEGEHTSVVGGGRAAGAVRVRDRADDVGDAGGLRDAVANGGGGFGLQPD